ncbi:hypothetical protein ACFWNL_19010 [Kitasatospora sp. NPDC058397]|uniref:hypothetical protein n=1 Tax=unclassified Kitasatospora TaxID=2633591 RepID=UPI00365FAC7E
MRQRFDEQEATPAGRSGVTLALRELRAPIGDLHPHPPGTHRTVTAQRSLVCTSALAITSLAHSSTS